MWFDESIFYQIYPLGAAGSPLQNDGSKAHRILKLKEWAAHLSRLHVDCVLFNPLFESVSHGYDTTDMERVDGRLGTDEDLQAVIQAYKDAGLRILFDAVFNHVGRQFFAFQDVLQNRENSLYKDWFFIDFHDNNKYGDGLRYQDWEGCTELVKLNLKNPDVVQYLLDTVDGWKEKFGIDGLRLDVAYCLDEDFLRQLHDHVKTDPEFYLMGEALFGDYNRLVNDEMLDACTNYECYKGLHSSFNSRNFFEILYSFNRQYGKEPWCLYTGKHLWSFVDNHDVERIASILEKKEWLPLIYGMLFTMPGVPCIYYGSEWGIEGKKSDGDPALRPEIKELGWNGLTDHIQKLAEIYHDHKALQQGDYVQIALTNESCIYQRALEDERIWTALNIKEEPVTLAVNGTFQAADLLTGDKIEINGTVQIPANGLLILDIKAGD